MFELPKRKNLVHKAIEPRKLSAKVQALMADRNDNFEVKYDGCHCILVKADGVASAWTRQGEPVLSAMGHVLADLEQIQADNFVLFAEAWHEHLEHETINGTFRRHKLDETAELLEAVVFDYVPLQDFIDGACPVRQKTRRDKAYEVVWQVMSLYDNESFAPCRIAFSAPTTTECSEFIDGCRNRFGATFATDGYMRKDPNGLWKAGSGACGAVSKIKDHLSIDVKVLAVVEGKGKYAGMVGALRVLWGLREITVGGGKLTDTTRDFFWNHPEEIIGKIVEVHGLAESKHGDLREGRFIRFRDDKTEGE